MNRLKDCILSVLLSFILLVSHFGCSATPKSLPASNRSSLSETETGRLNVAIVPSEELPLIDCITYDTGRGRAASESAGELAGKGAVAGALFPIYAVVEDPTAIILLPLWPILIPAGAICGAVVGATAGAIAGAIKGDYREGPMAQAEEVKKAVAYACALSNINNVLAGHLVETGQLITDYKYTICSEDNIATDADIILRAGISHLEFRGEDEKDPDTRFKIRVNVLVEDAKKRRHHSGAFEFVSNEHELSDWLADNGKLLQQEYESCYRSLSTNIIKDMFITNENYIADLLTPELPSDSVATEKEPAPGESSYHLAYVPETQKTAGLSLRKQPETNLKEATIKIMLSRYGFFDRERNAHGAFENDFVDNHNGTITDHATGLMWQRSGSMRSLSRVGAKTYIEHLNVELFGGQSDWRLPTVEELASLLQKDKVHGLYIDPLFDNQPLRCWSSDGAVPTEHFSYENPAEAWVVDYKNGQVRKAIWFDRFARRSLKPYEELTHNYVKAVRSVRN